MATTGPGRLRRRARLARVAEGYGIRIADTSVCRDHQSPMDFMEAWAYERPGVSLVLGSRGSGKSYLSALSTHLDSSLYDRHDTVILGGSEAQSRQIYAALGDFEATVGCSAAGLAPASVTATQTTYATGGKIKYIPASAKSVRGPHVQRLQLDEVDEIDPDLREAALGMCMAKHGVPAMVAMTSTWHRVGGPMSELLARGDAGEFPVFRFCVWEVLERCPDERSGPDLERCPECPLVAWCHADPVPGPDGRPVPKAKRSNGHYAIESLIQKLRAVSLRVLNSDYFCRGPKADGVWFRAFDRQLHVRESAEYDPATPVHCSVDSGVFTAAVFFQVRRVGADAYVNVFAEYLSENVPAEQAAREVLAEADRRCGFARSTGQLRVSTDSAGGARNPLGPTVIAEYERAGLRGPRGIERWPKYPGSVQQTLALLEALIRSADGTAWLSVHPRCRATANALEGYARAKRAGQWMDYPEDPQHPHEDLVDALRGGLKVEFPDSRRPSPTFPRAKAGRIL